MKELDKVIAVIMVQSPSVKIGLDDHYGRQTVMNMLEEALTLHDKTDSLPCKCGAKTFTHRHSNWIECTDCNKIKIVTQWKHLSNYQCFCLSCYLLHTQPKPKIQHVHQ